MWRYPLVALLALAGAFGMSSRPALRAEQAAWAIAPESVRTPAALNSAQPQLSVSNRGVLLSWIERTGDLGLVWLDPSTRPGSAPAPAFDDGWKIAACAVNGPALSVRGRDVALAWFTVKQDQGQAYVTGITANRASGYPRTASSGHELVFAWTESIDGGGLQVRTAAAALPGAGTTSRQQ